VRQVTVSRQSAVGQTAIVSSQAENSPVDAVDAVDAVVVVGIGADGWPGLSGPARQALATAAVIVGGARHLAMLPSDLGADRQLWPSPLLPNLGPLVDAHSDRGLAILASGDPMFFGIGGTLARLAGSVALRVIPHLSSLSLACARLAWPVEDVEVLSLVGRPLAAVLPALQPSRRLLLLLAAAEDSHRVAELLRASGLGPSELRLLSDLGAEAETEHRGIADSWDYHGENPLSVLAIEVRPAAGRRVLGRTPGLPDDSFEHDGQLTKREIRALTLSGLAPAPGELLWDVGAGSGSVGIEWMRCHPDNRAIAIEPRAERRARIAANVEALGVPALRIVDGKAPHALAGLPRPDAVFVGGGVSVAGVLEACLHALPDGGRLVANGVTLETESVLAQWYARLGGSLSRIAVQRASPVGAFTGWRPAMPVTQWTYFKESVVSR
jgi:precorrin-6Y C5,15-methyltransferase (decarboxylating)